MGSKLYFSFHIYLKLEIKELAFVEVTSKSSVTETNAFPLISVDIRISMIYAVASI